MRVDRQALLHLGFRCERRARSIRLGVPARKFVSLARRLDARQFKMIAIRVSFLRRPVRVGLGVASVFIKRDGNARGDLPHVIFARVAKIVLAFQEPIFPPRVFVAQQKHALRGRVAVPQRDDVVIQELRRLQLRPIPRGYRIDRGGAAGQSLDHNRD